MTGAMDDGITSTGQTWDGSWSAGFSDFSINRIGPDTVPQDYSSYWGYLLNGVSTQIGGCQQQVQQGDNVLFVFAPFGTPLLELAAPSRAATGESFQVTVQENDGNGARKPAAGAYVEGQTTDSNGHATLSFGDAGDHRFKALRNGAVRSNAASVCVYAPGSGACGTDAAPTSSGDPAPSSQPAAAKDTTPPAIELTTLTDGKTYARGPRVLGGQAEDAGGIAQVFLRLRATDGGDLTAASRCRWFSSKRSVFTHRTVPCSRARFFRVGNASKFSYLLPARLRKGKYVLDVKVLDRAYNAGRTSVAFGVK